MAGVPGFDPTRLFIQLQNTGLSQKDQPLYQLIYLMIQQLAKLTSITSASGGGGSSSSVVNNFNTIQQLLYQNNGDSNLSGNIMFPPGGISSGGNGSGLDYVVMADGGVPITQPVGDGAGGFIYIPYNP